jgi:hypothetical protein
MRTSATLSNRKIAETAARATGWVVGASALSAACGGLYGLMFGALTILVIDESRTIISIAAYFALCGAISGALVGSFGAMILGDVVAESEDNLVGNCGDRVFLRPHPRINPLIARWRFLEGTAVNGAHVEKNGACAQTIKGAAVHVNGAAIEASTARLQQLGPVRDQPRTSRAGAGDKLN